MSNNNVSLNFEQISFSVFEKEKRLFKDKKEKILLKKVDGSAQSGGLTAIIGGSGSGKSTLLDLLSGRKHEGKVEGKILIGNLITCDNHLPVKPPSSAYVMQDDAFLPNLTVRETLEYAFCLKNKKIFLKKEDIEIINSVLDKLLLTKIKDSKIGTQLKKGISGGERRRLTIGLELLSNPKILFLDEPTSGLDSTTALKIIETIKEIAIKENCIIISSIHQPSSTIFQIFDNLVILAEGYTVYNGSAKEAIPYFKSIGFECGNYINPAEFFLDTVLQTNTPAFFHEQFISTNNQLKIDCHNAVCLASPHNTKRATIFPLLEESLNPPKKISFARSIFSECIVLTRRSAQFVIAV